MDRRQPRVAVLGGGSGGTTVASIVARSAPTVLWARSPEVAEEVDRLGRNSRYLGDLPLTDGLRATDSLAQAVQDADVLVMGVPSHGFRGVLEQVVSHARPWIPVVSLVKGLEQVTDRRMTEIVAEVLPGHPAGVLAGPNIAKEVMAGYAAAATIAMPDQNLAAPVVMKLAAEVGVDMPIAQEVDNVLWHDATVQDAYRGLLRVVPGHELHGEGW